MASFVATNQSGVARGYYTESDVQLLHEQMNSSFRELGGNITKFFYCPHLPGAPVKKYDVVQIAENPLQG